MYQECIKIALLKKKIRSPNKKKSFDKIILTLSRQGRGGGIVIKNRQQTALIQSLDFNIL